jgi:DNA-directed RNA polymerase alpha subunit
VDAARNGELVKVRNLGRKSLEEVLCKIKAITGEDYSGVYGVQRYV